MAEGIQRMDIFIYLLSDYIWLPLLEIFIACLFFWSVFKDVQAKMRKGGGIHATVKRGEKCWSRLLSFWAISIIFIEIIISSELIDNNKIVIGLLNLGVLVYLNLLSSFFRNKIIGWSMKIQKIEENV